jgi:hypothetical protein
MIHELDNGKEYIVLSDHVIRYVQGQGFVWAYHVIRDTVVAITTDTEKEGIIDIIRYQRNVKK